MSARAKRSVHNVRKSPCSFRAVFLLATLSFALHAQDVVVLRNGTELLGRLASSSPESVELRVPSGRVQLERSKIRKIDSSRPFERYITYGWQLLEKDDFGQAEELYTEGVRKFTTEKAHRELMIRGLLESGRGYLEHRRFVDSRRALETVSSVSPDNSEATRLLAEAGRMCRKIQKEVQGYLQALESHPENDLARYHLGLRYESLGETEKARTEYETILKRSKVDISQFNGLVHMRGFINRHMVVSEDELEVESQSDYTSTLSAMEGLKSPRVNVYHYNRRLALEVVKVVDRIVPALERDYNVSPTKRPYTIFIYKDETEYAEATNLPGSAGFAAGPGKIHLYQTSPRLLKSVLPHELVHATLYRRYRGLPSWLDEGLAVRHEQGPGIYYDRVKQWMKEGATYPIDEFMKKNALRLSDDRRRVFYGQAYTMVDFLFQEHGGRKKMLEFLTRLSDSRNIAGSLDHVYGLKSLTDLEARWRKFMEL